MDVIRCTQAHAHRPTTLVEIEPRHELLPFTTADLRRPSRNGQVAGAISCSGQFDIIARVELSLDTMLD